MRPFRVWLRPLGEACRIRVEGLDNATWLRDRVVTSLHVECHESDAPLDALDAHGVRTLVVRYGSQRTQIELDKLLAGMSELEVMCQPA